MPVRTVLHAFACLVALVPVIHGAATGALANGQAPAGQTINVDTVGPKVGDRIPDFSLRDQRGQVYSLQSLLGSNGAIIVFFRSADW